MKASSLPNLNRETTSFPNFFTFFQDPDHHHGTTLNNRLNIDHSEDTEASETSPFIDFLSPFVSVNEIGFLAAPSSVMMFRRESEQSSVGSNQFSGDSGSEGTNPTQLWWDQRNHPNFLTNLNDLNHRKTTPTWSKITPNLIDDGHSWREFGQKDILNAAYRRNYYRCTHEFDQGCQATKQVQRIEEDPPMYQITYHGNHSCKDPLKAPHIILDSIIPNDSSNFNSISFGSTHYPNTKLNHEPYYPTLLPSVKQEYSHNQHEQKPSSSHNQSTSTDRFFQLPDSMVFDFFEFIPTLSSGSDHGDVTSSSRAADELNVFLEPIFLTDDDHGDVISSFRADDEFNAFLEPIRLTDDELMRCDFDDELMRCDFDVSQLAFCY